MSRFTFQNSFVWAAFCLTLSLSCAEWESVEEDSWDDSQNRDDFRDPDSSEPETDQGNTEERHKDSVSLDTTSFTDAGPKSDTDEIEETEDTNENQPHTGWIGSSCLDSADCDYEESVCIGDFPDGMCTMQCDLYCPDRENLPTTFCTVIDEIPGLDPSWEGACVSRCDYGIYSETGCRHNYGCQPRRRANAHQVERYVCLPGEGQHLEGCLEELARLGISFEPIAHIPESPPSHPDLVCTIADPILLHFPIYNVDFVTTSGNELTTLLMSCPTALAIAETVQDLEQQDVATIIQGGVYNCRVIAGTDTLSRHAHGDAIDIFGFEFTDGTVYTVLDDWQNSSSLPRSDPGEWLYETVYRWHEMGIWNVILTPNYNTAHVDHFHLDLTPDSHFIQSLSIPFIGPAPFLD